MLLCFSLVATQSVEYLIQPNDRIMFIGDSSTFQGSIAANGFVRLFEDELAKQLGSRNIAVFNAAVNLASNARILANIQENRAVAHFQPTKIIMVSGTDQFANKTETSLKQIRFETEALFAAVSDVPSIQFIFCATLPFGEKIDGSNPMDVILEEYVGMTQRVAKVYDVAFVDLYSPTLKYLESTNIDNLPSSILTYNGTALNAAGHQLVSSTLLKALGVVESNDDENVLTTKQREALEKRAERVRIREFDLKVNGIRSIII